MESAIEAGEQARAEFSHFRECNKTCLGMISHGASFLGLADKVCRLFVVREGDMKRLVDDPLVMLLPAMFGTAVPLLWTEHEAGGSLMDEATYIQKQSPSHDSKGASTSMAIRYSERSKSLLVLGCCDSVIQGDMRPSFEFMKRVRKQLNAAAEGDLLTERVILDKHPLFPMGQVLRHYGHRPEEFLDDCGKHTPAQMSRVRKYFAATKKKEPRFFD